MVTITLEPLRWQEQPSRVSVCQNGEQIESYLQVTAPCDVASLCTGRPVEELPRILSTLTPAHHLASALALDSLFGVTPPTLALTLREGLSLCLTLKHHLKKIFLLLSSFGNPFEAVKGARNRRQSALVPHQLLDEVVHGLALAQEAASILGGRSDHPLSAVAGGVSRSLKESHCTRLEEIALASFESATRLRELLYKNVFSSGTVLEDLKDLGMPPLASLALGSDKETVVVTGSSAEEINRFSSDKTQDHLEARFESWSYRPFSCFKGKGQHGISAGETSGLYSVGPLARLNQGRAMDTPLAEEERKRLLDLLGPLPHFSIPAAYWSLTIEILQASEKVKDLCTAQQLEGSSIREIPKSKNEQGHAALEAPEGFIFHKYRVNGRGIVEEAKILDAATANNALQVLVVRNVVESSVALKRPWDETKRLIELSLMPF